MDNQLILQHIKHNLGLTLDTRDEALLYLIDSAKAYAKGCGIDPEGQTEAYQRDYYDYIVDVATWRYQHGIDRIETPYLRLRKHRLQINKKNVE